MKLPRRYLPAVTFVATIQAVTLVAFLLVLRVLVDLLGSDVVSETGALLLILVGIAIVNAAARAGEFWLSENMGYEQVRGLRMRMYRHLQGMSPRQIQGRARGGLILRFTGDLSMQRTWVSRGIGRGLSAGIVVIGGTGAVAWLNVRLAVGLLSVLLLGTAATLRSGPTLQRVTKWVRKKRSLLTSNIDEQVNSLAVVQVFGRTQGEFERLSRQNDSLTKSLFRTSRVRAQMLGVATITGWAAILIVLWIGSIEVAAGRSTVGAVTAALVASRYLVGPVRRLALAYDYRQRARISQQKIREFLRSSGRPIDNPGLDPLVVHRGDIELRQIELDGALAGVNAEIPGGQVVALIGPNGAGKSSLLNVISGLEEPTFGRVMIDGQSLGDHTLLSRYRKIGFVSADLPLMRGTVARNLTYRRRTASEGEIERIILTCGLDSVIDRLPDGLSSWIVEGGANLSLGERRRLALGRALMGNPPILLLDEPTSGLDEETSDLFRDVIRRHHGTVVLATHDPREAALADVVWMMDRGRVVEVVPGVDFRLQRWLGSATTVTSGQAS